MTERDPNMMKEQNELQAVEDTSEAKSDAPSEETEGSVGKSMLVKVALASVLVASLVISIANLMVTNQLRDQTDEYQAEFRDYKEKNDRLKYYLDKEVDDEYIVEYARENLDMYFPDEEIYYNDVNE